jgi:hypothetical protein
LADDPPDHDDGEDQHRAQDGQSVRGEDQSSEAAQAGRQQRRAKQAGKQSDDEDGKQAADERRTNPIRQLADRSGQCPQGEALDCGDPSTGHAHAHRQHRIELG